MPVSSPFPDVHVVDKPFHVLLLEACRKYGADTAVIDGETNQKYTYDDISYFSHAFASYLHGKGLRKGDTLALCLGNCPQFIPVVIGSMMRGVIPALINPAYTKHELPHFLKDSGAKIIVTQPEKVEAFQHAIENAENHVQELVVLNLKNGMRTSRNTTMREMKEILVKEAKETLPDEPIYTHTDTAILPYSSGTSGVSKGVMISHYSLAFTYYTATSRAFFVWPTRSDHEIAILPFYHIYGSYMYQFSILEGVPIITVPRFEPQQFLTILQDYKIRIIHLVPPILLFLAKHPMVDQYDLSNVHTILTGAAPVGKDLSLAAVKRFPNLRYLLQGYGMTEHGISLMCPATPVDDIKYGSCGNVASLTQVKITDQDTGAELEGPNKTGEICVKSQSVMTGYWRRPKQTAETIDSDGWMHTGDLGYYDEDGDFFIVDRLKELIKVKGFQVAPAELEDILHRHEDVADCAVIGVNDERSGEAPLAFVVVAAHSQTTAQHILDFVNNQVADFKKIRQVKIVKEIPKSPSGKILRRILRDNEASIGKAKI